MDRRTATKSGCASVGLCLAGCLGTSSNDGGTEPDRNTSTDAESPLLDDEGYPVVADVDWDVERRRPEDPGDFRFWLTMYRGRLGGHIRFNYVDGWEPDHAGNLFHFTDIAELPVDGSLIHAHAVIYLGSFNVDELLREAENAAEYDRTGEYGGFQLINDRIAVGDEAIVVSIYDAGYQAPIDRYNGRREPLETIDPGVTRLFEELPPGDQIEGEYVAPLSEQLGVEGAYLRGVVSETYDSPEYTWVYLFPDESDLTEAVLSELESPLIHVEDSEIDGRVARITGTLDMSSIGE